MNSKLAEIFSELIERAHICNLPIEDISAPQTAEDWKKAKKIPKNRTTTASAPPPSRSPPPPLSERAPYKLPSCGEKVLTC